MKDIFQLTTVEEIDTFLENHALSFLYVSSPDCSTCHALLPKLEELLADYPLISFGHIDASKVEAVAEKFLILAAPIMLLIIERKEFLREDRFVRFGDLKEKLDRIYDQFDRI
ncbi:thioredoxin family protein [Paenibacillus sp. FSL K6-2862]|uniref:thioredoxin family protein n=1 Tax=Paenibacillus sp. FSL K6-2862 TaxID=2921484 RepID=UPI0030F80925